jgi:hypothetical protein
MKLGSTVVILAVIVITAAAAQNPPVPKPSPELKRLEYWVGNWTTEFEFKTGSGPAGKIIGKVHEEWLPGGYFVVSRAEWTGAMGNSTELSVMGYNADEKAYTYNDFNGAGGAQYSQGTLVGDTWTLISSLKMNDKKITNRFVIKEISPTLCTFKLESAPEGGDWVTIMEGKSTKTP